MQLKYINTNQTDWHHNVMFISLNFIQCRHLSRFLAHFGSLVLYSYHSVLTSRKYTLANWHSTWKWIVGILVCFSDGLSIFRCYVSFGVGNQPPFLLHLLRFFIFWQLCPLQQLMQIVVPARCPSNWCSVRKISSPNTRLRAGRNCGKFILLHRLFEQLKNWGHLGDLP